MGKLRCFLGFGPYLLGVVIQFSAFSHLLSVVRGGTFPRLSFFGQIVIFVTLIETLLGVLSSLLSLPYFVPFFLFFTKRKNFFFLFKGEIGHSFKKIDEIVFFFFFFFFFFGYSQEGKKKGLLTIWRFSFGVCCFSQTKNVLV